MKKLSVISFLCIALLFGCKKKSNDNDTLPSPGGSGTIILKGAPSPMGDVGTTFTSSGVAISGVSSFSASVTNLTDTVSTYTGSVTVTNAAIKSLLANVPEITITGDNVTTTTMKFKNTVEGIQFCSGPGQGILVLYSSNVGAKYPIGTTGKYRTVVRKDVTDDYAYGMLMIKVMKIEEDISYLTAPGITKIAYYVNHRFGIVGFEITFDDSTTANFPVYCSTENP